MPFTKKPFVVSLHVITKRPVITPILDEQVIQMIDKISSERSKGKDVILIFESTRDSLEFRLRNGLPKDFIPDF